MTPSPVTIPLNASVQDAQAIMRNKAIRHLPVTFGQRLVGVVTDKIINAAILCKWGEQLKIGDVMLPDPYVVSRNTALEQIIDHMVDDKLDSAIVTDHFGEVIGIFTSLDALQLLRQQK